jgi:hypothetical protein
MRLDPYAGAARRPAPAGDDIEMAKTPRLFLERLMETHYYVA